MEINLEKYYKMELVLVNEILENKLTLNQVRERCNELWELIPTDVSINPVRLDNLIKDKHENDPDWKR